MQSLTHRVDVDRDGLFAALAGGLNVSFIDEFAYVLGGLHGQNVRHFCPGLLGPWLWALKNKDYTPRRFLNNDYTPRWFLRSQSGELLSPYRELLIRSVARHEDCNRRSI